MRQHALGKNDWLEEARQEKQKEVAGENRGKGEKEKGKRT